MSRYPFSDNIEDYIGSMQMTDGSRESARRRLGNLGRVFHQLKTERKIFSDNPSRITADDVREFIERRISDGVSASTVRRDLQYLDGYLTYHDNDAAEIILMEESDRSEDSSKAALDRILRIISRPDKLPNDLLRAFSFVILVIVLGTTPDCIRKSVLIHGLASQSIMDYNLEFIGADNTLHNIRLNFMRLPIIERYIKHLFFRNQLITRTPMFPSKDPLFRFISPDDMHRFKQIVEKNIDAGFDYRICQRLFRERETSDNPEHRDQSPRNYVPDIHYSYPKKGVIGRIKDIF